MKASQVSLLGFCLIVLACVLNATQFMEYTVKAVFLEQFTRFIEWPDTSGMYDTSKPFILGVLGENPFGATLEEIYSTRKIKDKNVKISYFSGIDEVEGCHLLFISKSMEKELSHILSYTKKKPVLTVSDTEGFAEKGVLINLFLEGNSVRFEINEAVVRESGLFISYLLLKHAKIIAPKGEQE